MHDPLHPSNYRPILWLYIDDLYLFGVIPMKLSDFKLIKSVGKNALDLEYFAEVTVTSGALWWKKAIKAKIHKTYGGSWHFLDSGKFTPEYQAEELYRSYLAKQKFNAEELVK